MPTGDAYSSGRLVPFRLEFAYVLIVETNPFPELFPFPYYAPRTFLGSFLILPSLAVLYTHEPQRILFFHHREHLLDHLLLKETTVIVICLNSANYLRVYFHVFLQCVCASF